MGEFTKGLENASCVTFFFLQVVCIILIFMEECICLAFCWRFVEHKEQSLLPGIIFFDYDITMESKNAILIHTLQERGVLTVTVSSKIPLFAWWSTWFWIYWDWNRWSGWVAEIRRAQEMFVRLKPVEALNKILCIMINECKNSGK